MVGSPTWRGSLRLALGQILSPGPISPNLAVRRCADDFGSARSPTQAAAHDWGEGECFGVLACLFQPMVWD